MKLNPKHKKKLFSILSISLLLSLSVGLILYALKQNINLFYTPTQLLKATLEPHQVIRIGGTVQIHSVKMDHSGQSIRFIITDHQNAVTVHYQGILPSLFREGQGVVVTGTWEGQQLIATQVLAKHDEKYMPLAYVNALKEKSRDP